MGQALLLNMGVLVAAMLVLWGIAARIGDVSFIDAVWGGGMAALTLFTWVYAGLPGGRGGLIAGMVVIWGTRLGWHLFTRWRRHGEDARYAALLARARGQGHYARGALMLVFGPQAVLLFITCLPAQLGVLAGGAMPGALAWVGAMLWLLGMVFEVVGDAQLARFKADPASKGRVLDSGLWRYTRHPNYFGDACVWWGIWLAAADAGWPVALGALIGPAFLTFTLTRWSGKPLLEAGLAKSRPGYGDYVARTSGFVPWWPKRV